MGIGILNREAERARERFWQNRAEGYKGKTRWLVIHELRGAVTVFAPDAAAAIYTAAKVWGMDGGKAAFHQNVRVMRVGG